MHISKRRAALHNHHRVARHTKKSPWMPNNAKAMAGNLPWYQTRQKTNRNWLVFCYVTQDFSPDRQA